jgi:hypothetical protein
MARQNKASTVSILIIGLSVIIMIMASSSVRTSATARRQSVTNTPSITPTPCETVDQDDCDFEATETAQTFFETQTATPTGTITRTPGTTTPTTTRTASPTPTGQTGFPTPFPTEIPTPAPQVILPTPTPIPTPSDALTCSPGDPVIIAGTGPPRAAFLVYFDQRVVSGGSVAPSGHFSTRLVVGRERAGIYTVTVRVRGTSRVLRQVTCSVPDVTPTLLPRGRGLP